MNHHRSRLHDTQLSLVTMIDSSNKPSAFFLLSSSLSDWAFNEPGAYFSLSLVGAFLEPKNDNEILLPKL